MNAKKAMTTMTVALFLGLPACGDETSAEDTTVPAGAGAAEPSSYPAGEASSVSAALSVDSVSWYRWSKGDATVTMKPFATHVCGLTMVRGELARNTSLRVSKSGDNWVMRGDNPGSNFLQMDAVCEPLSAFTVNVGVTAANLGEVGRSVGSNNSQSVFSLQEHAVPVLIGLSGNFNGGGERAFVTLDPPTVGIKKGTSSGTLRAFANSVFFGPFLATSVFDEVFVFPPSVDLPKGTVIVGCIRGEGGRCGEIATLATAFCYLDSVSGDFNGADEWVQVFPNKTTGYWELKGSHGGGSVFATAQCLTHNQQHTVDTRIH